MVVGCQHGVAFCRTWLKCLLSLIEHCALPNSTAAWPEAALGRAGHRDDANLPLWTAVTGGGGREM